MRYISQLANRVDSIESAFFMPARLYGTFMGAALWAADRTMLAQVSLRAAQWFTTKSPSFRRNKAA